MWNRTKLSEKMVEPWKFEELCLLLNRITLKKQSGYQEIRSDVFKHHLWEKK